MAKKAKAKKLLTPLQEKLVLADQKARELLRTCTDRELDHIGRMIGMHNLGQELFDRPEIIAESEEMYDGFMEEIRCWQRRLRNPRDRWGWCDDLPMLVAHAKGDEATRRKIEKAHGYRRGY